MISILISFLAISLFIYKLIFSLDKNLPLKNFELSNVDITEPKFTIKNLSQIIFVTAREGNFIENDKILLKKNVKFKSKKFTIQSDNVIFDRTKQTAYSENKSTFKSNKTTILSEGFNIIESGNKINFHGNSKVILND